MMTPGDSRPPSTRPRTCRVCGCTEDRACVDDGLPCHWLSDRDDLCSACAGALEHPIAATVDTSEDGGDYVHLLTCRCGWRHIEPFGLRPADAYATAVAAAREHWLAALGEAASS